MRHVVTGVLAAAVLVLSIAIITTPDDRVEASSETYRQLNLFGDVFAKIREDYVEEVDDEKLIEAAINGMLSSLDPHSSYLNPKNYDGMKVQTRGKFGGLGIEVTMENGLVKVVAPIDDTPAAKAGILAGDYITHLDDEPVLGLTLAEAVEKMRGLVDTDLKLTIRRAGEKEPLDITLTRAIITVQSVRGRLEGDDIFYVRISSFTEQTDDGLRKTINRLKEESGNEFKGLILDLRNNPGGLLDQAIAVSDDFLEKGEIVSTRGRKADDAQRYNAKPDDIVDGKPIVVLINGGSASASEIVAGALQDHGRAVILGTKSFGKGSVQTIVPLQGNGAMRMTTARYYTPSGTSIQAKGIVPDIEVEQAKLEVLEPLKGRSEADLRNHLDNGEEAESSANSATEAATKEEILDYQLLRAKDLLKGVWLFAKKDAK
ncbi:S41 family peptidase [Sneathiella sp. CAU 1612]|jgi:carboxyl-terminal processing protease|uniref:S41 family peptidase n=1 Tax=Sneathiella sedimenti TaxID=2816034 RepID=A0ABS3F1L8_9PROT|nr:S41 family peptidase [Sneathiella sedimenti]MBO0332406.1 S41 family peptidase [Sneathiella sedimenti]